MIDQRQPQLETDPAIERQAKPPWKGIRLHGSVESEFLFATLLSDNMLPFGQRGMSLLVLPVTEDEKEGLQLLDFDAAVGSGSIGLANWLRSAEEVWAKHRKSAAELLDWINWQNKLASQIPAKGAKLVFNKSGTHLCSCVVRAGDHRKWRIHELSVSGFIADYGTYMFEGEGTDEVHYLCSLLNAPLIDNAIKPYQTKGAFGVQHGGGERDIHRRPFEVLPIPRFDADDRRHRRLAELSEHCHKKVGGVVDDARATGDTVFFTAPIGRLRTQLRKELLAEELTQIDALVAEILESAPQ